MTFMEIFNKEIKKHNETRKYYDRYETWNFPWPEGEGPWDFMVDGIAYQHDENFLVFDEADTDVHTARKMFELIDDSCPEEWGFCCKICRG